LGTTRDHWAEVVSSSTESTIRRFAPIETDHFPETV
jgi:hypothetical protein